MMKQQRKSKRRKRILDSGEALRLKWGYRIVRLMLWKVVSDSNY